MTTAADKSTVARINRKLTRYESTQYLKVHVTRNHNVRQNYGNFILLDTYSNALLDGDHLIERLESRITETYLQAVAA